MQGAIVVQDRWQGAVVPQFYRAGVAGCRGATVVQVRLAECKGATVVQGRRAMAQGATRVPGRCSGTHRSSVWREGREGWKGEGGGPSLPRASKLANVCYFYGGGRGLPGPAPAD